MEMEKYELIDYLRTTLELEVKCYGIENIIKFNEIQRQRPKEFPHEPMQKNPQLLPPPTPPEKPQARITHVNNANSAESAAEHLGVIFVISVVIAVIFGVYFHPQITFLFGLFGSFIASMLLGYGIVFLGYAMSDAEATAGMNKTNQTEAVNKHNAALAQYRAEAERREAQNLANEREIAIFNLQARERHCQSVEEIERHNFRVKAANEQLDKIQQPLVKTLKKLQKTLDGLYELGFVYFKYRNILAFGAFLQYFESGRCDELEGAHGAYNIFENEFRLDCIIGRLDLIIANLEQIRKNQYGLYCEIQRVNHNIEQLTSCVSHGLDCIVKSQDYIISYACESYETTRAMSRKMDEYVAELEGANDKVMKYLEEAKRVDRKLLAAKK